MGKKTEPVGYFWNYTYRIPMRDTNQAPRRRVLEAWTKAGLKLDRCSRKHEELMLKALGKRELARIDRMYGTPGIAATAFVGQDETTDGPLSSRPASEQVTNDTPVDHSGIFILTGPEIRSGTMDELETKARAGAQRFRFHMRARSGEGPNLLKAWRKSEGLTQGQAAKRLGVAQARISEYETGSIRPDLETAVRIERETDIPPSAWVA